MNALKHSRKNTSLIRLLKKAFVSTLPVLAGYIVLGIGFGILLSAKGYGALWAFFMSVFLYSGSMQYLAVDLLAEGATLITTALVTFMVNARHLFYGISLVDKYKGAGKKKPYMIFALTDETYSLVCNQELGDDPKSTHTYFLFISILDHIYWICGCVIGDLLGQIIPFSVEGIDFVLTALFVTIFVEQWKSTKDHISALIGVVCSVICLLIFGSDGFLIPSMIAITLALTVLKKVRGEGSSRD